MSDRCCWQDCCKQGMVAIVAACPEWGVDNNLTRCLSVRDPLQIVH